MENNETTLKANSISKLDVIIMAICAAGPVMCLSGSLGDIMSGSGTAAALAFLLATVVLILASCPLVITAQAAPTLTSAAYLVNAPALSPRG